MKVEAVAAQVLRALRGKRTQSVLSRRLGYRTNVVNAWEAARAFPTASKFFGFLPRMGVKPNAALIPFYRKPPEWLNELDLGSCAGVCALLQDLRGKTTFAQDAAATGRNRFAVSRWFNGLSEPRLHEFFALVEACTLRLPDFIACFIDPAQVAELAPRWKALTAARRTAYELPWSNAVLRALELAEYRALPRHETGWLAMRLGISQREEAACLTLLSDSEQIRWHGSHYQLLDVMAVDTRRDGDAARALAAFWAKQGVARLENKGEGNFAYNLIAVSHADLERIRDLQRSYFAEIRSIVAASQPVERVAVVNLQLFALTSSKKATD